MNGKTWGWIIGIIVVILIILGIWWAMKAPAATPPADTTTTASSTDTTATNPAQGSTNVSLANSSESVSAIVAGLSGASQFQALFNASGVAPTLGARGPYTIFVSTDAGFNLIAPGTISGMTAAEKKRLVQYSIVSGRALDIDATNSGKVTALSGDTLNFSVQKSGLVEVNSSFALQEYKGTNGIVYVINQPLLPPVKAQ